MQNARGNKLDVASTVKHFAAYGSAVNGHDRVQAEIPIRYLQDEFLPSYEAAIRRRRGDGHDHRTARSTTSRPTRRHFLQTTELRKRLGFQGVLISDYGNIPALISTLPHGVQPRRGGGASDQRGRRRLDDAVRLPGLHRGRAHRRPQRLDLEGADRPVRPADPHAEVPARAVRPPLRRPGEGRRSGHGEQGPRQARLAGVARPAAQPEQCPAAVAEHRQDRRHRARAPTTSATSSAAGASAGRASSARTSRAASARPTRSRPRPRCSRASSRPSRRPRR